MLVESDEEQRIAALVRRAIYYWHEICIINTRALSAFFCYSVFGSWPLSRTIGSSQHASGVAKLYSVNWLYCKNSNSFESWASEAGQGIYLAWRYIRTILYSLELHWCWEGGEPEKYDKWFDENGFLLLTHSEEDFLDEIVRSFLLRRWWWGIVCHLFQFEIHLLLGFSTGQGSEQPH